jgi:hypothetical protein
VRRAADRPDKQLQHIHCGSKTATADEDSLLSLPRCATLPCQAPNFPYTVLLCAEAFPGLADGLHVDIREVAIISSEAQLGHGRRPRKAVQRF